jgi:hypothetical protein
MSFRFFFAAFQNLQSFYFDDTPQLGRYQGVGVNPRKGSCKVTGFRQ